VPPYALLLTNCRRALRENKVLIRIFRPKKEEVIGGCRKLHSEELHDLYYSLNIIRVTKSRRMTWHHHAWINDKFTPNFIKISNRSLSLYCCMCAYLNVGSYECVCSQVCVPYMCTFVGVHARVKPVCARTYVCFYSTPTSSYS
jgi:hypothetical protein